MKDFPRYLTVMELKEWLSKQNDKDQILVFNYEYGEYCSAEIDDFEVSSNFNKEGIDTWERKMER